MKEAKLLHLGVPPFTSAFREGHPERHVCVWGQWDTVRQLLWPLMWSESLWVAGWAGPLLSVWPTAGRGSRTALLVALGDETSQAGILRQWQLTLYGSVWSPVDIRDRQR